MCLRQLQNNCCVLTSEHHRPIYLRTEKFLSAPSSIDHLPLAVVLREKPSAPFDARHPYAQSELFATLEYRDSQDPSNHKSSKDTMSSTGSSNSGSNPSMLHGHAAYVAAAAKVCIFTSPASTCTIESFTSRPALSRDDGFDPSWPLIFTVLS